MHSTPQLGWGVHISTGEKVKSVATRMNISGKIKYQRLHL